jgi:hypothetical protein
VGENPLQVNNRISKRHGLKIGYWIK